MKHRKRTILCLLFALAMLCGCAAPGTDTPKKAEEAGVLVAAPAETAADSASVHTDLTLSHPQVNDMFTKRDFDFAYAKAESILLKDGASSSDSSHVRMEGDRITIGQDGIYTLNGSLSNGQIVIQAPETAKVQLVLDHASVTCADSAAIYIVSADKVFITTAAGSENALISTGTYPNQAQDKIDGAVYAKTDLCFNGEGHLTVSSQSGHAIVTKDDLKICSGSYEITAAKKGLSGKDSVRIGGGEIVIRSQGDGIHSEHSKSDKGFVFISGGRLSIESDKDGIDCSNYVKILGGAVEIRSGGGAIADAPKPQDSCKGIRSQAGIEITGGNVLVNALDDGIKSDREIILSDGQLTVCSARDALESRTAIRISGGTLTAFTLGDQPEPVQSEQGILSCTLDHVHDAGHTLSLSNANGDMLMHLPVNADHKTVFLSSAELAEGSYSLHCGEETYAVTVTK